MSFVAVWVSPRTGSPNKRVRWVSGFTLRIKTCEYERI